MRHPRLRFKKARALLPPGPAGILAKAGDRNGSILRVSCGKLPLDEGRSWSRDSVVPADEIYNKINKHRKLIPVVANNDSETAKRYVFEDGIGEIGIIASVTKPFCGNCNRIRLTADGKIRTCLFSHSEQDLKQLIRVNASDEEIVEFLKSAIKLKEWGHKINDPDFVQPERTMSYIGG